MTYLTVNDNKLERINNFLYTKNHNSTIILYHSLECKFKNIIYSYTSI